MTTRSLTGASIHAIILAILESGDSYGYDIIQRVRQLSDGEVDWAAGSLYPVLHRMKTNGWIEDYWVEPDGERRRRYYRITARGRAALEEKTGEWMVIHRILEQLRQVPPTGAESIG